MLHDVGLLERERRGSWVFYRVSLERFDVLRATLEQPQPALAS